MTVLGREGAVITTYEINADRPNPRLRQRPGYRAASARDNMIHCICTCRYHITRITDFIREEDLSIFDWHREGILLICLIFKFISNSSISCDTLPTTRLSIYVKCSEKRDIFFTTTNRYQTLYLLLWWIYALHPSIMLKYYLNTHISFHSYFIFKKIRIASSKTRYL